MIMPPAAVKTIKDVIFWQYAKLISKSVEFGIKQRAFQMNRFKSLLYKICRLNYDAKFHHVCYSKDGHHMHVKVHDM